MVEGAGEVVAGCALVRLLGRGATGTAHLGRRLRDGREVVVKQLAPELARLEDARARFVREWQALQKVGAHPNVVEVLALEDGPRPVIVMELVVGAALDEAMRAHGRLAAPRAVRVARDVARGLEAVHACGLVHRDVKPANIVVAPDGAARLIDFGVAKDLARRTALTAPGELLGTACYMAPEVWEDQAADARVDLFALGATLYQLVAGRPPFEGRNLDEVADRVVAGAYPPLRDLAPDAGPELAALVAHLLEPEADQRCASAADCARDLDLLLAGQPTGVPALVDASGARRHLVGAPRSFTLGRDPACEVVLAHPSVAPRHAQLRRTPAGFELFDLRSPGTWLGAERVAPGAPRRPRPGDVLRLGEVALRFSALRSTSGP